MLMGESSTAFQTVAEKLSNFCLSTVLSWVLVYPASGDAFLRKRRSARSGSISNTKVEQEKAKMRVAQTCLLFAVVVDGQGWADRSG